MVAISLWIGKERAQDKKKKLKRDITSLEPFLESVPAILIMTIIWTMNFSTTRYDEELGWILCPKLNCSAMTLSMEDKNKCAVFGDNVTWFFTAYSISVLAGSFGIIKFLQDGPCSVLPTDGLLDGIFTWRFTLAYFSTMFSLVSKVMFPGILMWGTGCGKWIKISSCIQDNDPLISTLNLVLIFVAFCILPNIILSVTCVAVSNGISRGLKILVEYPSLIFLPVITFYVVGPRKLACCSKNQDNTQRHQLVVSKKLSAINVVISFIGYGLVACLSTIGVYSARYVSLIAAVFVPVLILGIILTFGFLYIESCCSPNCCMLRHHYIDTNPDNNEKRIEICQHYHTNRENLNFEYYKKAFGQ